MTPTQATILLATEANLQIYYNRSTLKISIPTDSLIMDLYDPSKRMRGDLAEMYKIIKGLDKLDAGKMFPILGESRTRGHSLRIKGRAFYTEVRSNFFTQRVVNLMEFSTTEGSGGKLTG